MKNLTVITALVAQLILIATSLTTLHAQTKKDFTINGTLMNMPDMPKKVYLSYDPVTEKKTDSSVVDNGKYSFKGTVETSVIATLTLIKNAALENKERFNLMLDNGTINIISDQSLSRSNVTGDGTTAHTEYLKATEFAREESAAIQKIVESATYKNDESLKTAVSERSTNLLGRSLSDMIVYVKDHPTSSISPYLTYALILSGFVTPEMTDTLYRSFPKELSSSKLKLSIDATLEKRNKTVLKIVEDKKKAQETLAKIGSRAIDFTQNDINDKPVSLSSYNGKYVLIDFWASWCAPCRAENPTLVKAFNTYKDRGFNILGVSLDGKSYKQAWIDAIKKDGLIWTQVSDLKGFENQAALLYGVTAIPQNFLIDPNGVIIAINLRGEALEQKLKEIIK